MTNTVSINRRDSGSRWDAIENDARFLQLELWNRRYELWNRDVPSDPIHVLQPGVALGTKGYSIETTDFLGELNQDGKRTEVAGLIDRDKKIVRISGRFPTLTQRFTAAHELGHAVLHPHGRGVHRDRPLDGSNPQRDWEEREADRFASCFLMPAKQVRSRFIESFRADQFTLTDATAFALCAASVDRVRQSCRATRDFSRKLAQANTYGGYEVAPLNSQFGVSTTAMAIRLEELGLIA